MSHARAAIAGMLSAGVVALVVQDRILESEGVALVTLGIIALVAVLLPEVLEHLPGRHRRDDREDHD